METTRQKPQTLLDHLFRIHEKTSSFTAKLIGPTVFNFGAKEKNLNLSTAQLLLFPEASLGKALGDFLRKHHVEPLAGAEYHDIHHVLFGYSITFVDEVALQFFLQGNGKYSIASISTCLGAWFILPFHWKYLIDSYKRGKTCKDISAYNFETLLQQDFKTIQTCLFETI